MKFPLPLIEICKRKRAAETNQNEEKGSDLEDSKQISSFRRILPQVLACSAKNLLILEFGLSLAFPTILIPVLSKTEHEGLHATAVDASWLASIMFIFQPFGSILSGVITEPLGRKVAMQLVNIPHVISWICLYKTESLFMIYTAFALQGFAIGLMEAPIFTYLGEISEPSIRGPLTATAGIAATIGLSVVYWLSTLLHWRQVALFCAAVPVIATTIILFVPETPIWLLGKNRTDEALKSLQWLRGWTNNAAITEEFKELQRYKETAHRCYSCEKQQLNCSHPPPRLQDKLQDFLRKRTLIPFCLIAFQFILIQFCGIFPMRPYIIQILDCYHTAIDASQINTIMGLLGILANIVILFTVQKIGKRRIYLYSAMITMICCFALSFYGFQYLPLGVTSFDQYKYKVPLTAEERSYVPVVWFLVLQFATGIGIATIPNMMLSELFPFKSRALATGLAASTYYISGFIGTKTYYNLETALSLPGILCFYGFVALFGFIAMYLTLPETENRTLEEIESYFSDKTRRFTDIKIEKKFTSTRM